MGVGVAFPEQPHLSTFLGWPLGKNGHVLHTCLGKLEQYLRIIFFKIKLLEYCSSYTSNYAENAQHLTF